ncbi:MAG: hypothetical protein M0P71_00930 [Melioribacteraceae bacterium]|nr:hypothetical protein [Melioribacteraceae bacterium]
MKLNTKINLIIVPDSKEEVDKILDIIDSLNIRHLSSFSKQRVSKLIYKKVVDFKSIGFLINSEFYDVDYLISMEKFRYVNLNIFMREFIIPDIDETFYFIDFNNGKICSKRWRDSDFDKLLLYFKNVFIMSKLAKNKLEITNETS